MEKDTKNNGDYDVGRRSLYDVDPPPEEDLWFLPGPPDAGDTSDLPWTAPARMVDEQGFDPQVWRQGEAQQYRALTSAAQAVARFAERLSHFPGGIGGGIGDRFALGSVAAVMRAEGVWLSVEKIALFRAMRIAGDDNAQDLARAAWAVRRLSGANRAGGPLAGLHVFLGRNVTSSPPPVALATGLVTGLAIGQERAVGDDLDALSGQWLTALAAIEDCHPLTRAGFAFAFWRAAGITPFDEMLEPSVAAMLVGAGDGTKNGAGNGMPPFLPVCAGRTFDRQMRGGVAARLAGFYAATEAGALKGLLELDRLRAWQARAGQVSARLSGRTPALLIDTLVRLPVVSAELAAHETGCSGATIRRNLARFDDAGLIREVTGQDRYRFWTARL